MDENPGDGTGNGRVVWSEESGFAGMPEIAGDTGWSGDPAGALNRFLRWDSSLIVDTRQQLQMPLKILNGDGIAPRSPGYPTIGNRYEGPVPLPVDVTLRRTQNFQTLPGEVVHWTFGALEGTAVAGLDGAVTVEGVPLPTAWTTLVVGRP